MQKVLLVIDMQKDFVDGSLGTPEAVAIVDNVAQEIGRGYDRVILTRDTHQENYLETLEGKNLPVVHCVENTDGWQLDKKVEEAVSHLPFYTIINKPTFGSEDLISELKRIDAIKRIDSLTVIGLCTDICVVSNALMVKAAFYDRDVRVLQNCCAGVTPATHDAALETMKMCQITVE